MQSEVIKKIIETSLWKLQKEQKLPVFDIPEIKVERPENTAFGDFSTNIALVIQKDIKAPPLKAAELITEQILQDSKAKKMISEVEAIAPGFINIKLSGEYLANQIPEILKDEEGYGNSKNGKGKKYQIEFVSANPTGPLTLGNARGGFLGDALANVLERTGFDVGREYYLNDVGVQVKILGQSVLAAAGLLPDDAELFYHGDYLKEYGKSFNLSDYLEKPEELGHLVAGEIFKKEIKETLSKRMGIKYDVWFSEKSLYDSGEYDAALKWLKENRMIYEKDGATWFKSSEYGDDKDRVIKKKDGETTYLASDIPYHKNKFERGFDRVINIWGADHHGYVSRMKAAVEALGYGGKLEIIIVQLVRVIKGGKEFRMSKRKGMYISLDWLLNEVGLDAARFFFLMKSANAHLNFDLDLAKERSAKNPVYYVQYAHARISSILKKARESGTIDTGKADFTELKHKSELDLIREILKWPEYLEKVASSYEVHLLPYLAIEIAKKLHLFYRDCQVLQAESEELKIARVALLKATKIVLKNILSTLGVSAPEKM